MSTKLNFAVLTAVNFEAEQIDVMVKLKGLVSKPVMEGIINRVVDRSQANFRPAYDVFTATLEAYYSEELAKLFAEYTGELHTVRSKAGRNLAGFEDLQRLYLDDAAKKVNVHVGEVKAGEPIISLRNLPGLAGSVAILSLRKVLQRELVQGLVTRLTGALGSKLIVTVEGPLGWIVAGVMAGHDVYSISREINNIPDKLKNRSIPGYEKGVP